jgi:hypothetical protein
MLECDVVLIGTDVPIYRDTSRNTSEERNPKTAGTCYATQISYNEGHSPRIYLFK